MATIADFRSVRPTWCPACGDFAVLTALQKACVQLGLEPHQVALASGIGCSGKIVDYFAAYGFHGLHGRALPIATGIKMANPDLTVIAAGGDGDGYGIGVGHFVHAMRRNIDITYLVMDNHIYGLTTGQLSPTSDVGFKTKTSPYGSIEFPVQPLELAIASGCTFVAQGYSGKLAHLTELVKRGLEHKGFSLINVFSPCATFNKQNTYEWYNEHLVNLDEDESYDRHDRARAMAKVIEHGAAVIGVIYEEEGRPTYERSLAGAGDRPLARKDLSVDRATFERFLREFV